jgi:hypothetical protein
VYVPTEIVALGSRQWLMRQRERTELPHPCVYYKPSRAVLIYIQDIMVALHEVKCSIEVAGSQSLHHLPLCIVSGMKQVTKDDHLCHVKTV